MGIILDRNVLRSPIRWAGSKKPLLTEMLAVFDEQKAVYIEPFLGSGVVLINALNNNAFERYYVNDINENVITFFSLLKSSPLQLISGIDSICNEYNEQKSLDAKSVLYYKNREIFNEKNQTQLKNAIIFWLLMTAGYNGVYRVNSKGGFNVPFGKRERIVCDKDHLKTISDLIQHVEFSCLDYHEFIDNVFRIENAANCFLYCDPPYIPSTNSMIKQTLYTSNGFNHLSFVQYLTNCVIGRNASLMISMVDSTVSQNIYTNNCWNQINLTETVRKVNPSKKLKTTEVAYLNYPTHF